ncbi:unnamed protein product [Rotaria socialis]|uniref:F-box domain-containing protein n=1 Tax=Rotaria socialis TaxID=392032 RepID=A0A820RR56_9BILA|nr:unnamed protein product [Rotaria socialis]CAF4440144.1 unnamed protein product [Rotaria socialis]
MNLEFLPNELLFNFFDYLNIFDLFKAFYSLNSQFNSLILAHCHQCRLDFRSTNKTDFDIICKNYLPCITDQIVALRLSDNDNTPQQIGLFLSYNFRLHRFINLQTISLSNLHSSYTLNRLINEFSTLISLTDLILTNCYISINRNSADRWYDKIWSLSKLKYCYIDINFANRSYFPVPTVISQSLKHLSIPHISCYFNEFIHLFKVTPNLQHLTINFLEYANEFKPVLSILPITHLKLSFDSSLEILQCILQNSPDLLHLTLEICNIYMDGYQWEDMIRRYLPKLKVFRFKMRFSSLNDENKEIQSNQILESFRTKFWIDEHQWFVRCHWYSSDEQYRLDFIDLFTLPYAFKDFLSYTGCTLAKSTCPTDDQYWSFDQVNNLCYGSSHFKSSIMSRIRFSHIEYLSVTLPFNDQFLLVVSTLDRLTSLCISVNNHKKPDNILSQMQMLLDRAPNLLSLSIASWSSSSLPVPLMENTSESVRQLNLQGYASGKNWCYFDDEQCHQLSQSPLGIQCETLSIKVKNRRNILYIVNNMPNLRALNVRCEDDLWKNPTDTLLLVKDELTEWLQDYLPFSSIIMRDTCHPHTIRLWIR